MGSVNGAPGPGTAAGAHPDLRAQQTWMSRAVIAPQADPDAGRMLTPGPLLTSAERLQIYRDGYRGRLVECLADDYAAVQFLLGEDVFESVAHDYIDEHPSRSPNLIPFGRFMPGFLARRADAISPFAADLARLEWAIVEAIHAAPSPTLTLDRLGNMTPEQWNVAKLVPAASAVVLRFDHAVNAYYQAFRSEAQPTASGPEASATLVHRQGWVVWRTDLTPSMARLLQTIVDGAPLGAALESSIPDEDEESQAQVMRWFQDWVRADVFTAVDLPET